MSSSISVAIIDDEWDARSLIKLHLQRHSQLHIIGEAGDGPSAQQLLETTKPDLIFLDIQMPGFNGIEILNRSAHLPKVIFITAYNDFAIKAFELNAVDYLLKPFTPQRFDQAVSRAINRLTTPITQEVINRLINQIQHKKENTYLQRIAYKKGPLTEYVEVEKIHYIKSADQYVELFLENHQYLIRQSMDYLEKQLSPDHFFRIHRSAIVHLSQVKAINQDEFRHYQVMLHSGVTLPLSQVRKGLLAAKLRVG